MMRLSRVSAGVLFALASSLSIVGKASAGPIVVPLSTFVIFAGGGVSFDGAFETSIGGHTQVTGNIGSNQDLFMQGDPETNFPALLMGGAYAGGQIVFGQDLTVGSNAALQKVIANGTATIVGGDIIWGTVSGAAGSTQSGSPAPVISGGPIDTSAGRETFTLISMPLATPFSAGGPDQTCAAAGCTLTLPPSAAFNTYGAVTLGSSRTLSLTSGTYYFDSMSMAGGFTLKIDLSSGLPIYIYVVGDMDFGQNNNLLVLGAGTGGVYKPIKDFPNLAKLIYMETHGVFTMGGNNQNPAQQGDPHPQNIWGGTLYASDINLLDADTNDEGDIDIGQYMNWTGAAWAFDRFHTMDHGTWNLASFDPGTPTTTSAVPEPTSLLLLGTGVLGLGRFVIRKKR